MRSAALLLAVQAAPALAQQRLGGGGTLDISFIRVIAALLVSLMLAAIVALLLKRAGGRIDLSNLRAVSATGTSRRIEVLETRRISQHADVALLRCDGRDFLILCAPSQQTVLRESAVAGDGAP